MEITGDYLLALGYPAGKVIGIAKEVIQKHFSEMGLPQLSNLLMNVLDAPDQFLEDERLAPIALALQKPVTNPYQQFLNESPEPYKVYGAKGIDEGAILQMDTAMKLPITVAGALMPDAHQGYGLPIGGVLATKNTVIPYGVGVDIGCRMCMSIYDVPASFIEENRHTLKKMLVDNTKFGRATFKKPREHEVIEDPLFTEIKLLKGLKDKAFSQLGSSGGGNHFVEFGITAIIDESNEFGLAPGKYLALLSHSGSRGLGATIASHYTKLAMKLTQLPREAKHLAWLDLDSEAGQEYWQAMNLAGNYASACHHQIHDRMAEALRTTPIAMVENHHNFAWKEKDAEGNEIIVHRKGATPAGKGVLGIIPGSMTAPGFIVRGKGDPDSINSASHGAGRAMSRTQAKKSLDPKLVATHLKEAGVELIGSGLDEAPMAYKDINIVMGAQHDLVEMIGTFLPKVVRMCGDETFKEVD